MQQPRHEQSNPIEQNTPQITPKEQFRVICEENIPYIRNIDLPIITKNNPLEAVLIEYRCFPHMEFLIRNAMIKLGDKWSHTVVCGNLNYDFMVTMCANISPEITIIKTDYDNLNQSTYSVLLASKSFWEMFVGEKILLYQEDSCIFKSNIDDFLQWDYIGAPWLKTQNDTPNCVGNGGFSLRTRQCMIDVIDRVSIYDTNMASSTSDYIRNNGMTVCPEDVYFSKNMQDYGIGRVADWDSAFAFSSETVYNGDSFGGHCIWQGCINWKQIFLTKINSINKYNDVILENILNNFILNNTNSTTKIKYIDQDYSEIHKYREKNSDYKPLICFDDEPIDDIIPKKIHKIFLNDTKDKIPNEIYNKAINTWREHYPDFEVIIYDKNDAQKYILNNYGCEFLYVYNLLIPFAFKADFLRLCILYNEGGIYSDLKQVCNYRLNIDLNYINFIYSNETYNSWIGKDLHCEPIQNCFIGCCKKHPYIKGFIDLLIQNVLNERYNIASTDITGPIAFARVVDIIKKNWEFMDEKKEFKLYFNSIDNMFFINHHRHRSENSFVKHKYDNSSGADWSNINLINNNYGQLWRECTVYKKIYKTYCKVGLGIINYLNEFTVIIDSNEIYTFDIVNKYKSYQTFILINTNKNNEIIDILINYHFKILDNENLKTIYDFITIYKEKINILISNKKTLDLIKYLNNNDNIIPFYSLHNFLKEDNHDFLITKKHKRLRSNKIINDIKPYAIYFPQFHEIIENNINFYQGYTDITNLELFVNETKTIHETPSCSEFKINNICDYNLTKKEIIQKQIDILCDYNLSGFAMYYYWFSTNTITNKNMIMEKCIDIFFDNSVNIKDKKIFFIWANENWTNNVALSNSNNVISNEYNEENIINNINNLLTYFKHDNYLKIDNKPVLFIYHVFFMKKYELELFNNLMNKYCMQNGFSGFHLVINSMNGYNDGYKNFYMNVNYKNQQYEYKYYDNQLSSHVLDYERYVHSEQHIKNEINTIFYDFDNRVRFYKPNKLNFATTVVNNDEIHKIIFTKKIVEKYNRENKEEIDNILLINAWNEWGEKMTLEPSNETGYYNLNLLHDCLS